VSTVTTSIFRPFGDDHPVVRLGHPYDVRFITALKAALAEAPPVPGHSKGGWLHDHRTWFCEQAVLAYVRLRLEGAGFQFVEQPESAPPRPPPPPPPPPPPRRDLVDVRNLVATWYRQAAIRYHPDKGGTDEQMKVVNYLHDRHQARPHETLGTGRGSVGQVANCAAERGLTTLLARRNLTAGDFFGSR
jgi:hypothetical protein